MIILSLPPPLPLRLGNQWAASPGETGLPRHKSHTHTIFHPVSPSFILFSTLPLFPSHCLPLPPLLLFWLCFSIPVFIMLPQVPRYYSFYLSYLTFLYFSVSFSHFFPTIVSPPPPFVSLSLSVSPASSSKFTSHHPLSQTGWGWVATCRVQHGC